MIRKILAAGNGFCRLNKNVFANCVMPQLRGATDATRLTVPGNALAWMGYDVIDKVLMGNMAV